MKNLHSLNSDSQEEEVKGIQPPTAEPRRNVYLASDDLPVAKKHKMSEEDEGGSPVVTAADDAAATGDRSRPALQESYVPKVSPPSGLDRFETGSSSLKEKNEEGEEKTEDKENEPLMRKCSVCNGLFR